MKNSERQAYSPGSHRRDNQRDGIHPSNMSRNFPHIAKRVITKPSPRPTTPNHSQAPLLMPSTKPSHPLDIPSNVKSVGRQKERTTASIRHRSSPPVRHVQTKSTFPTPPPKRHRSNEDEHIQNSATHVVNNIHQLSPEELQNSHQTIYKTFALDTIGKQMSVTALLDSGSVINIISKDLVSELPYDAFKQIPMSETVRIQVADGSIVNVTGTGMLQVRSNKCKHSIFVHILEKCSHPLICGLDYLCKNKIVMDFSDCKSYSKSQSVKLCNQITIPSRKEVIISASLPKNIPIGTQGTCQPSNSITRKGLLGARILLTRKPSKNDACFRIYNPTNASINLFKGDKIATFTPCENLTSFHKIECNVIDDLRSENSKHIQSNTKNINEFVDNNFKLNNMDHLSIKQQSELKQLLFSNRDVFVTKENPSIGISNVIKHTIKLKNDYKENHIRPYRLSPEKKEVLRHHLDELLKQGVISFIDPTEHTVITSPIVLVQKRKPPDPKTPTKEQSLNCFRFTVDYRFLNSQILNFQYQIPDLQELTESLATIKPKYISCIDLSDGFFQMGITEESSILTAFNTCFGTYKFNRLPQGLKTSSSAYQMLIDRIFHDLSYRHVYTYIDDLLCVTETFEEHLKVLSEIFARFRKANLKISSRKSTFCQARAIFLGHDISAQGIKPPADKLDSIKNYPKPKTVKQCQRFLGLTNWLQKFCPHYASISAPLYNLLKKNTRFEWTDECQNAFDKLKSIFSSPDMLSFPRSDLDYYIMVDTSAKGIGYILYQLTPESELTKPDENNLRIIRFGSKSLKKYQSSYGPTKLELLGVITAVTDCSPYIRGRHSYILCDHEALSHLTTKQFKGAIYDRWLTILCSYNITIRYITSSDARPADALSRAKIPTNKACDSPSENDDAFFPTVTENPTQPLILPDGQNLTSLLLQNRSDSSDTSENCHHNNDTRHAQLNCISRQNTTSVDPDNPEVVAPRSSLDSSSSNDSSLSDPPSSSDNDNNLNPSPAKQIGITEHNTTSPQRDTLNQRVDNLNLHTNSLLSLEDISQYQLNDPQLKHMIIYLRDGILPQSQSLSRQILLKSCDYIYMKNLLFHTYKPAKNRTQVTDDYQLVVPQILQNDIIAFFHDSRIFCHAGASITLDRIKSLYFFDRMSALVNDYVLTCHECQSRKITKHTKHAISAFQTPTKIYDVFEADVLGPLPVDKHSNKYLFTAVCMFSKYIFAIAMPSNDALTVSDAVIKLSLTHGFSSLIFTDCGSENVAEISEIVRNKLNIPKALSPPFSAHCIGAIERTHRTFAERLTPYVTDNKDNWSEFVDSVVFSMNTSFHSSLNCSPFEICHGQRASFPLISHEKEISIPPDYENYLHTLSRKLDLIRKNAHENIQNNQKQMCFHANKKLHILNLKKGDYVYMRNFSKEKGAKLSNSYTGPFVVHEIQSEHLVFLIDPSNKRTFKHPVHINNLKIAHLRENKTKHPLLKPQDANPSIQNTFKEKTPISKPIRQSDRLKNKTRIDFSMFYSESSDNSHKVKKIIAQRTDGNGHKSYLIQYKGEPAQNSRWIPHTRLDPMTKRKLQNQPPPPIIDT